MSSLPPILVELRANAGEFMTKMGEARHEVQKLGTESAGHAQRFAQVGKAALFGVAGAAVVVGAASLELADRFEQANARLEGAVANAHGSFEQLKPAIEATNNSLAKFGFTSDQVESAVATLTNATKNPALSLHQMSLAADIARGRNIDLATATGILVKVQTGHVSLLGRLGIATKDANGKTISQTEALRRLAAMYGGDAARNAETFAGKTQAIKAQIENLGTKIGLTLIPILLRVIDVTMSVVNWFEHHRTTAEALGIVIGGVLVAAITTYIATLVVAAAESAASLGGMIAKTIIWAATTTGAAGEAEVAWVAANSGMLAASIASASAILIAWGPLIIAVAALGIAAYELYKHWGAVWGGIKAVFSAVWGFLREHFGLILTAMLGPLGFAIAELLRHWQAVWGGIKEAFGAVWNDYLKPQWDAMKTALHAIGTALSAVVNHVWYPLWNGIQSAVQAVWSVIGPIFDTIKHAIGDITGGIGKVVSVASHLPGVGSIGSFFSHFAAGTDYAPGGMALVGERGPEVVNIPRGSKVYPHGTGPGGGGGVVVNINGPVYGADADHLADTIQAVLLRKQRRGGSLGFSAA